MKKAIWAGLAGFGLALGAVGGCAGAGSGPGGVGRADAGGSAAGRLERDVRMLADGFGERSAADRDELNAVGALLMERLGAMGYRVWREPVPVGEKAKGAGIDGFNVVAERAGRAMPGEVVVVGAHYDTEVGTPGADDNASGVAGLLELARRFARAETGRTLRFIAFTNEEGSNSRGSMMGSRVSALTSVEKGERVVAMLSLEMLGYADPTPGSQRYPFERDSAIGRSLNLPDTGDFIAVIGRTADAELVERLGSAMAGTGAVRVVPVALPPIVPDMYRSDHANYWVSGYPAVMVTDTSNFRNPHYHRATDTADTLDYAFLTGVVDALEAGVWGLVE